MATKQTKKSTKNTTSKPAISDREIHAMQSAFYCMMFNTPRGDMKACEPGTDLYVLDKLIKRLRK